MDVDCESEPGGFAEQFPLSPADDYFIHQTPDPVRVAWTSDPRVYERYWVVMHDLTGDWIIATGGSIYPNLDTAEAYVIVTHAGVQRSVRAFRRLGVDRLDLRVGPIAPTIVRGMREWQFKLDNGGHGMELDINFRDNTRQIFREPLPAAGRGYPPGRRSDVTVGFESFGVITGTLRSHDETITIDSTNWRATRDRHWGVGRSVGGNRWQVPGTPQTHGLSGNQFVQFSDWSLWGDRVFYGFGDTRRRFGKVTKTERRLRFDPDSRLFLEGVIDCTLETGEVRTLHCERLGSQVAFMRCGMYGGTPDGDIHQGDFVGEDVVQFDEYDVSDPRVQLLLAGLDEHQCRVTCDGQSTAGVFQPMEPDAYAACVAGKPGWALLQ